MESLYRSYRPLTFDTVVGQRHVISTLEHAIDEGRLSHAYLFCGPRGTGKTTMARILAKALLCERSEGGAACLPDGTCSACELIADGTHPDVYELDAASRTGVDSVREEIIGSVNFAPALGSHKIYIIDEVHMLTTAAFNALLKTLEEPPDHVVFVLCTTDPQKIPETILSRCQRFDFHRISTEDIVARLALICSEEGFSCDDEALEIVAKHARGGLRDALSTLEQLSVFGGGAVCAQDARALLGEVATSVLAEFCARIATRDIVGLFELVAGQIDDGGDLLELTRDLVAHIRDVYMVHVAGARKELFDGEPEELAALQRESDRFESADRLSRVLTVLDDAALEMRAAADSRLVLEIALAKLARPESDLTLESLSERIERLEATLDGAATPVPLEDAAPARRAPVERAGRERGAGRPMSAAQQRDAADRPAAPAPAGTPRPVTAPVFVPEDEETIAPRKQSPSAHSSDAAGDAPVRDKSAPESSADAVTDPGELQRRWSEVVKRVTAAQASRGALLQSSRALADDGSTLSVGLPQGSSFALKMLHRSDAHDLIAQIVSVVFGSRAVEYRLEGEGVSAQVAGAVPRSSAPAASASGSRPAPPVDVSAHESDLPPFDIDTPATDLKAHDESAPSNPAEQAAAQTSTPAQAERPTRSSGAAQQVSAVQKAPQPSTAQPDAAERSACASNLPDAMPAQPAVHEEDAKDLLGGIFGDGVVFKDV